MNIAQTNMTFKKKVLLENVLLKKIYKKLDFCFSKSLDLTVAIKFLITNLKIQKPKCK